jgi:hypothetical protein
LNSPKKKIRPGDLYVDSARLPGIPATPSGKSVICCTLVMQKTDAELRAVRASYKGTCNAALLREIIRFAEGCPVLSDEEKSAVIDGLADWI